VSQAAYARCFDLKQLCHPDERSANFTPIAGVLTCVLTSTRAQRIRITAPQGHLVHLRGRAVTDGVLRVQRGDNLLAISVVTEGHHFDAAYRFDRWDGVTAGAWHWHRLIEPVASISNVHHTTMAKLPPNAADEAKRLARSTTYDAVLRQSATPPAAIELRDAASDFRSRSVVRSLRIERPERCFHDTAETLELAPAVDGAVELCLDFGVNSVGWIELAVDADAGAIIDGNLVEYVAPDGTPQYTDGCRNGFRYVCRDGWQHFVSFKRRGGRYLYLTIRATTPVRLRLARMLEATAPVAAAGPFTCSDPVLERIWDISTRTLRLCMEDTYTDCPLYEQVLWIGDARNEALYNHLAFGAWEVTWNSLRLGAESLERLPIIGSQVPSGWETQIPAWSLLWIIAVQETWQATGDLERVRELYPAMLRCIDVCAEHFDRHDLFSFQAWNFFDWAPIDGNHATVLHNSLLLYGALTATRELANVLKRPLDGRRLAQIQRRLRRGLHAAYDHRRQAWPDAIHADGTPSASSCQHTAALGLRFGGLPDARASKAALRTLLSPSPKTVRIGSPFALQFVLEALIAHGHAADAVAMMSERWGPMLAHGATTCWETFPGFEKGMLTRSHCHAWSAAPIAVLMNVVLGVTSLTPGARRVRICPLPGPGLTHASGSLPTPHGPLHIAWQLTDGTLHVQVAAPSGVEVTVARHPQSRGIRHVAVEQVGA
jgi:alpha-L-rhamnosidase